ncbi:MAG: sulfatase [Opitutaceae bacterium]|nr:sulfatase [Opitutaceae bacterium]
MNRLPPFLFALLLSLGYGLTAPAHAAAPARKPNVLMFLVDDMGWMDCGVYGSKYYETPNMDRFAQRAMRFTDAYATPLCSPTRATILSGKYTARHGTTTASGHMPPQPPGHVFLPETAPANRAVITPESKNYLDPAEYTLAEALRDAGWRTGHIGKWHLGLTEPYWPEKHGFDHAVHAHPDPGPPSYFSPYGFREFQSYQDGPPGEYITDRLTDEAIQFIESNRERPFFLDLWHHGVHGPWGHKPEYTKQFMAKKDPTGRQHNPIMASMLKSVDESFGRILDTLDRLKLTENTIVIFYSDNGGNTHSNTPEDSRAKAVGKLAEERLKDWRKWAGDEPPTNNTPLRDGKGTLYEGGVRVPLMWSWPGVVKPGTVSGEVVGAVDLYPTILDAVGVQRPGQQKLDGVSYVPVLKTGAKLNRTAYFQYFPHGNAGKAPGVTVRSGDFKLIRWFETNAKAPEKYELYNLREDLGESRNLAGKMPAKVKELDMLIDGFLKDTNATYPRPNPAYRPGAAGEGKAGAAGDPAAKKKKKKAE